MRLLLSALCLILLAFALPGVAADAPRAGQFQGQLLVSTRHNPDPRFDKTVIYLVRHTSRSSFGIVVNKPIGKGPLAKMMQGFGLDPNGAKGELQLNYGGPVAITHAFFLHTSDYADARSEDIDGTVSFTKDARILTAFAAGKGPRRILVALGYAGWTGSQLEGEILRGFWSVTAPSEGLVFGDGKGDAWERMVERSEVPL